MFTRLAFTVCILLVLHPAGAQSIFRNPSLEGTPNVAIVPPGWSTDLTACGGFSTPDIQPGFWETYLPAHHGNSYIGMVARDNGTSEGISQQLDSPLTPDRCYAFTLHLAKAPSYSLHPNPATLEVWAGKSACAPGQLLWTSPGISHGEWRAYEIEFTPKEQWPVISFLVKGYASNILIDNITNERMSRSEIVITGPDTICENGAAITLIATGPDGSAFAWNTGAATSSISTNTAGQYEVKVTKGACVFRRAHTVHPIALPILEITPDSATIYGKAYYDIQPYSSLPLAVHWNSGDVGPTLRVYENGIYIAAVSNECGLAKDSIYISFVPLFIPNIVTANHDSKNDTFIIQGIEPGTAQLTILNRWGKVVYHTTSYRNEWPATPVPAAVYYYVLKNRNADEVFKGSLSVVHE